jgi:hypothetical protein
MYIEEKGAKEKNLIMVRITGTQGRISILGSISYGVTKQRKKRAKLSRRAKRKKSKPLTSCPGTLAGSFRHRVPFPTNFFCTKKKLSSHRTRQRT